MQETISADEPLTINFEPIETAAGPISSITVREPTAAQIAQWSNLTGTPAEIKAISICCDLPIVVIEQLKARTFVRARARVEAFLESGQSAGSKG